MFHGFKKKKITTASPNCARASSATEPQKLVIHHMTNFYQHVSFKNKDRSAKLTFASKRAGHLGPRTFQPPQGTMQKSNSQNTIKCSPS